MALIIERVMIVGACCITLVLVAPVLVMVLLAVRLIDGGPALIVEEWADRRGRSIRVFSIRTNRVRPDSCGDRLWVSSFFSFLRRSDLDKLPRLVNILMGECDLDALGGEAWETWRFLLQPLPPAEDTAPEPIDRKDPGPPSGDAFALWDDQIDGLRLPEIRIDDPEASEGPDDDGYPPAPPDSKRRMLDALGVLLRPRGPQRPMPA